MTFKELREQSGMNMKQFAAHFEIPYRTIQNWEAGVNKCPEYLLKLMKFRLDQDSKMGNQTDYRTILEEVLVMVKHGESWIRTAGFIEDALAERGGA